MVRMAPKNSQDLSFDDYGEFLASLPPEVTPENKDYGFMPDYMKDRFGVNVTEIIFNDEFVDSFTVTYWDPSSDTYTTLKMAFNQNFDWYLWEECHIEELTAAKALQIIQEGKDRLVG